MKTTRLFLFVLLVAALSGCSATDDPVVSGNPENPTPENEFKDVGITMEDWIPEEDPTCYHSYFRVQNGSNHRIYFNVTLPLSVGGHYYYILPGEQATHWFTDEYVPYYNEYPLMDDLKLMGTIDLYFDAPKPGEFEQVVGGRPGHTRSLSPDLDTCSVHSFSRSYPDSPTPAPVDPSRWVRERFSDRRVRWTLRINNDDHDEAVRQTLERWSDPDYVRPKF